MITEIQYGSLVLRGNRPKAHVPQADISFLSAGFILLLRNEFLFLANKIKTLLDLN